MKIKNVYWVYYRKTRTSNWVMIQGCFNKTDALGTANNLLKDCHEVNIVKG